MGDEEKPQNFKDLIFLGFQKPNYTIVPDELFDILLPVLSGAEVKVLLYIVRRTFGFKKDSDNISLSQMLNGITTQDGRRLDSGVGLSKPTLLQALRDLAYKNVILINRRRSQEKGDESTNYRLNIVGDSFRPSPALIVAENEANSDVLPPLVKKLDQGGLKNFTTPVVKKMYQGVVKKSYPQDTVRQDTVNNVNVGYLKKGDVDNPIQKRPLSVEDLAVAKVLAQDIFEVFGDSKSREFYNYAAVKLIDHEQDVRFLLSTIKEDVIRNRNSKVQNPAALFVSQLKQLARDQGIDL